MSVTISGSSPTFSSGYQGGTIISGTTVTCTTQTTIDFTSIPSWAKRVTFMISGVSLNSTTYYYVQLGTAGGIQSSGYTQAGGYCGPGSGPGYTGTTAFTRYNDTANITQSGTFVLALLDASTNTWCLSGNAATSQNYQSFMSGTVSLSGTLTTLRMTTATGTGQFNAGKINILYE